MKFSIGWHEDSLKNSTAHFQKEAERIERAQRDLEYHKRRLAEYAQQIADAKAKGLDGFDSEKFGKSKQREPQGDVND